MRKAAMIFWFLGIGISLAYAAVAPHTINYQGRLTDLNGTPVADGTHSLTVSLYDSAAATVAKWADNFPVSTKNGYFNVVLGAGTQKLDTLDFSQQLYIGIRVDTDSEMTPRQALNGVPYALRIEVPIGSIIAWDKSRTGTPGLPANFIECNGQMLNDSESPYNGQIIANLNGSSSGTAYPTDSGNTIAAMFLRGGTTSGQGQMDSFQGHGHYIQYYAANRGLSLNSGGTNYGLSYSQTGAGATTSDSEVVGTTPKNDGTDGTPRIGNETRPVNMSVVWIMRIK